MATPRNAVLILATGGTIAGASASALDNLAYQAGSVGIDRLIAGVPALAGRPLMAEQLAQIDSKDMSLPVWLALRERIVAAQSDPRIGGIVVTHGTDTLEETAYWLHRTVRATRPVVLTAAMRPATSIQADGPQNLVDAVAVAGDDRVRGVVAALAGRVLAGCELRKVHNYRLDAFTSGDAGPLAMIEEGRLRIFRAWPDPPDVLEGPLPAADGWPWVEIVTSHAGADGRIVRQLVAAGVDGLVVAATGNGTLHRDLEHALRGAAAAGVGILRATRCQLGALLPDGHAWPAAGGLTPAQARVELLLRRLPQPGRGRMTPAG